MTVRSAEETLLDQGLTACACLPVQAMAAGVQLWCWQLQAVGEIASLTLAPWQHRSGAAGPSLFEKAAAQSLFDVAFCLGAAGEQRPFPD